MATNAAEGDSLNGVETLGTARGHSSDHASDHRGGQLPDDQVPSASVKPTQERRRPKVDACMSVRRPHGLWALLPHSYFASNPLALRSRRDFLTGLSCGSSAANLIFRCTFVVHLAFLAIGPARTALGQATRKSVLRRWRRRGKAADDGDCKIKGRSHDALSGRVHSEKYRGTPFGLALTCAEGRAQTGLSWESPANSAVS